MAIATLSGIDGIDSNGHKRIFPVFQKVPAILFFTRNNPLSQCQPKKNIVNYKIKQKCREM